MTAPSPRGGVGPGDLYALCSETLDAAVVAVNAAAAESGSDPIGRVYVSPGPPAWDCTQLTVHAGGPIAADTAPLQPPLQPGHRAGQTGMVNLVAMTITVIRCCVPVPTSESETVILPDPAEIEQVAEWSYADVWSIWNHLANAHRSETLWPPKRREAFFDPAIALGTSGGCAGWQIPLRVQLDGYEGV